MKTKFLLVACLLFAFALSAQEKTKYRRGGTRFDIRYGLKAGVHSSSLGGSEFITERNTDNQQVYPDVTYEAVRSWHAGGYMDIRLSELLVFQPEIIFSQMGSTMIRPMDLDNVQGNYIVTPSTSFAATLNVPITRKLTQLQIPLIAKIGINRLTHINVGPVISFELNETIAFGEIADSLTTGLVIENIAGPESYRGSDIGALLGISYQFQNGINANLRYQQNFRNVNLNEDLARLALEPTNRLRAIMLSIGYTFQYNLRLRESIKRKH